MLVPDAMAAPEQITSALPRRNPALTPMGCADLATGETWRTDVASPGGSRAGNRTGGGAFPTMAHP
jgi:hypothetical protein